MSDTNLTEHPECTASESFLVLTRKDGPQWVIPVSSIEAIELTDRNVYLDVTRKDGTRWREFHPVIRFHFREAYKGDTHGAASRNSAGRYFDVSKGASDTIQVLNLPLITAIKAMQQVITDPGYALPDEEEGEGG